MLALLQNLTFILPSSQQFLLNKVLLLLHKLVLTEKEDMLLCVTMRARAKAFAART